MNKSAAANERFHASGGVSPQTVLWEFGSVSPARTFVKPPPSPSRHHVICNGGTAQWGHGSEMRLKIKYGKISCVRCNLK
jgi:hypothetical protein